MGPLQWELRVLATGPLGKSPGQIFDDTLLGESFLPASCLSLLESILYVEPCFIPNMHTWPLFTTQQLLRVPLFFIK